MEHNLEAGRAFKESAARPGSVSGERRRPSNGEICRCLVAYALFATSVHNRVNGFVRAQDRRPRTYRAESIGSASFRKAPAPTDIVVHRMGNSAAPAPRSSAGDRGEKPRRDRPLALPAALTLARPTEPRAPASRPQPRAKVTSDSLTLAVLCCAGIRFFMSFRGPTAHPNRGENR